MISELSIWIAQQIKEIQLCYYLVMYILLELSAFYGIYQETKDYWNILTQGYRMLYNNVENCKNKGDIANMSEKKYILALRTKKLHYIECRDVQRIKHETKKYYTIEEAKAEYEELEFCKHCFDREM